jgi:putative spermidine/putrescine transport system permease protein
VIAVVLSQSRGPMGSPVRALGLGPGLLLVGLLLVVPLATLFRYSFNRFTPQQLMAEAFTFDNYIRFASEPYYRSVLATTFGLALLCVLTTLVLGFPLAYRLARTRSRWKSMLVVLVLFPLLVGNVVRAAGWMAVLGRQGFLNVSLQALGIIDQPLELLYTPLAVYLGMVGVLLPFMVLTLQGVLESIDFTLADAAQNLGAPPAVAFVKIVLPLSLPGVAAGAILVFTVAMNSYATPFLLGGPGFKMMAPVLYRQIAVASNWPFGAAMAFILIAVTFLVSGAATWMLAKQYKAR